MDYVKTIEQAETRKTAAIVICQAFWLTRLMVLAHLKDNFSVDPTSWIYWVNNGGQQTIVKFQVEVMKRL
jgi:hypothetical protein